MLVWAFSVIVQLYRLIVYSSNKNIYWQLLKIFPQWQRARVQPAGAGGRRGGGDLLVWRGPLQPRHGGGGGAGLHRHHPPHAAGGVQSNTVI